MGQGEAGKARSREIIRRLIIIHGRNCGAINWKDMVGI